MVALWGIKHIVFTKIHLTLELEPTTALFRLQRDTHCEWLSRNQYNLVPTRHNFQPLEVVNRGSETQTQVVNLSSYQYHQIYYECNILVITASGENNSLTNPLTAKLFNLNFHPLEVVSR